MEEKAVSLSMDSWLCCGPGSLPEVYLLGMSSSSFLEGTGTRKISKGDPVLSLQSCVCVNEPATARSMAPALSHDLPNCSIINLFLNLLCLRSTPAGETRQCPGLVIPTKGKDHWQKSEWAKLSVWGIKAICLPILLCHLPWGWGGGAVKRLQPVLFTGQMQTKTQVSWGCTFHSSPRKKCDFQHVSPFGTACWLGWDISTWNLQAAVMLRCQWSSFRNIHLALPHLLAGLCLL